MSPRVDHMQLGCTVLLQSKFYNSYANISYEHNIWTKNQSLRHAAAQGEQSSFRSPALPQIYSFIGVLRACAPSSVAERLKLWIG